MNNNSSKIIKILMAVFTVAFVLSLSAGFQRTLSAGDAETYKELKIFTNAIEEIEDNYVEPVDTKELIESAIKGMTRSLDPHSQYMPPDAYNEFQNDTQGEFEGIGIVITKAKGLLKIISPIEGTPAYRAGLQPGDIITEIDGAPTEDMELWEAVKKMRGEKGTTVNITVYRKSEKEELEFTLTRDVIPITSVKSLLIKPGYGYVWITNFQANSTDELTTALKDLKAQNNGELKGLILDLRNNPGGLLDQAIAVSDMFLKEGKILSVKERNDEKTYKAHKDETDRTYPVVTLINSGSASASEIVAGALQDNKRALILGTGSFGKGSVQTVKQLADGSAIKYTIARYYTPTGRSIQAKGIEPDIEVDYKTIEADKKDQQTLKEKDLKNHLKAESKSDTETGKKTEEDKKSTDMQNTRYGDLNKKKLLSDSQIKRALDTLVSYEIFKQIQ